MRLKGIQNIMKYDIFRYVIILQCTINYYFYLLKETQY